MVQFLSFFLYLFPFAFTKEYPSIKYPTNGIFKWFNTLSLTKNYFNNKTFFGFRMNTSELDLSILAKDIANHLNLYDLNISGKIEEVINDNNLNFIKTNKKPLSSKQECTKEYQNIYQFCRLTGINIDLLDYGIPPEHVDIMLSNIVGYIPCGLLLIILGFATIAFYIVQIILSFFFFKATENSTPRTYQFILFYLGDAILLTAAIFYMFSYKGINSVLTSLISLDSIVNDTTSSLSHSFSDITNIGIPDAVGPVIDNMMSICKTTQNYFNDTSSSFLNPTTKILHKLVSDDLNDLGVFTIYNSYIYYLAKDFYETTKKYPKLENISTYFAKTDFSDFQSAIQNLYDKELNFSDNLHKLNSFFEYINATVYPYQQYIFNLTHQRMIGTNRTVGELIYDFKHQKLRTFNYISELNQNVNDNSNYYKIIRIIFFVFGIILIGSTIFYAIVYVLHNKFSICIASTISIYPIIATVAMFFIAFAFTELGSVEIAVSNQLEPTFDTFLTNIIGITFPIRTIEIPSINITQLTHEFYKGEINLSNIKFPDQMNIIEYFVNVNKKMGLADSLQLSNIADLNKYGDELGNFIIRLGRDFVLPDIIVFIIEGVEQLFRLVTYFPKEIDGFFNWGVPMTMTTNFLRMEIERMDSSALPELDVYLKKIDNYVDLMNSQYKVALSAIYDDLAEALDKIEENLLNFIHSIMNDLGVSVQHLLKNVYPVLNYIHTEPIIGPYAEIRNIVFYDLASTSAYLSISGSLMMIGFVFIVVLMWIRRKGMSPDHDLQLRRNKSNKLDQDNNNNEKLAL